MASAVLFDLTRSLIILYFINIFFSEEYKMVSKSKQKNKNASNIINLLKQLINDASKKSKKKVNKNQSKPANKKIKPLPTSGDEPVFTEGRWGSPAGIRSNNCYDYAMNDYANSRDQKSSPGNKTGLRNNNYGPIKSCGLLPKGVKNNNPSNVTRADPDKKCPKNSFKVMMFISPSKGNSLFNSGDFHFYRQYSKVHYKPKKGESVQSIAKFFRIPVAIVHKANNLANNRTKNGPIVPGKVIKFKANGWAHKRGWATGPLLVDASNNRIVDPRKSNNNYKDGGLNYSKLCSTYCVRNSKKISTGRNDMRPKRMLR